MKASLRQFYSPDADLDHYAPPDPTDAYVLVQMMVGADDGEGEDTFDVVVCTPKSLTHWYEGPGPIIGRHLLIVQTWDWGKISAFLTNAIETEEAASWTELAERLGRIGHWEFEDYVEFEDLPPLR